MKQNIRFMLRQKIFGIPGLAVGHIDLAGFGIVDDMGPQNSDLGHSFFRSFDLRGQLIVTSSSRSSFVRQCRIFQQAMIGEAIHRLCQLFQIE